MTKPNFSEIIFYLAVYGVIGWILESIFCSILMRKPVNRGFLFGPYCPIYGVGAMVILFLTYRFSQYPIAVFFISLGSVTLLEYTTSWIMELLFQARWWDYSEHRFNLHGRICLENSLIFGVLGLFVVYLVHPALTKIGVYIGTEKLRLLSSVILVVFLADFTLSLNSLLKLTERLKIIQGYLEELDLYNKEYSWFNKNDLSASFVRLKEICGEKGEDRLLQILNRLEAVVVVGEGQFRHLRSFPQLKLKGFEGALESARSFWEKRIETTLPKTAQRRTVEAAKVKEGVAISFYRLFWVFMSASVIGFLVETIYCLVMQGTIESRQGLIYGPFSQVYGFGAVLMVIVLTPLAKKSGHWLFLGSAVLGGAFEYICSLLQEKMFNSVSWEYSDEAFSIGGRTSLIYMLFWGILGMVFIKDIFPRLSHLIDRIPKRLGLALTCILVVFISVDLVLSASAVHRWSMRQKNVPPANAYEQFLDSQYPDEFLESIYPNLIILGESRVQ